MLCDRGGRLWEGTALNPGLATNLVLEQGLEKEQETPGQRAFQAVLGRAVPDVLEQ